MAPAKPKKPKDSPAREGGVLRPSAELRYGQELERLKAADTDPRPPGWQLSARAVRRFVLGDAGLGGTKKFYGHDPLVGRAIVTLISAQGFMLVGEPSTAQPVPSGV